MKYIQVLAVLAAMCIPIQPVSAQKTPPGHAYERRLKLDIPIIAVAGGAALASFLADDVENPCPCIAASLNGLDRGTAGRRSDRADSVSNYVVGYAVALPAALTLFDSRNGGRGAWMDALVVGDAVAINFALNQWVKVAANRPRPLLYGLPADDEEFTKTDNFLSFYSQHTSLAFAAGLSYARTFALRHPDSRYRWLIYTTALANGAVVGTLRVAAGRHFPTDVLTGAAIGSGIGLAVPWLHPKRAALSVSGRPGGGVAVRVAIRL